MAERVDDASCAEDGKREHAEVGEEGQPAGKRARVDCDADVAATTTEVEVSAAAPAPAPAAEASAVPPNGETAIPQAPQPSAMLSMMPPPPQQQQMAPQEMLPQQWPNAPFPGWGQGTGGKPCKDFSNGCCHRGAQCKFAHIGTPNNGAMGGQQFCKDFQNGLCTRGAGCKFSHAAGDNGLQQPSMCVAPRPPSYHANSAPQAPYGVVGGGAYGGGAYGGPGAAAGGYRMPHCGGGGGPSGAYSGPPAGLGSNGVQQCKDYMQGRCSRGQACRFSHEGLPDVRRKTMTD